MGHTAIEKIIMRNTGAQHVTPGEIVVVKPDRVMIHDIFVPFVAEKYRQMGFTRVWNPDKVVLIYDHLVPAAVIDDVRHFKTGDAFAEEVGLSHVHRADGICHQLMVEQGYVKPGDVAFGTDSHTTTYGAVGAFSTGIGYTEMAAILGTGSLWVRVPSTIRVEIEGELPPHVSAKDIILRLLGDIGADGAVYQALEFAGGTVDGMSLSSRMAIANMAVEAGAKCAVFPPDEVSTLYSGAPGFDMATLAPDADAVYDRVIRYKAGELEPVVACPSQPDNICPVRQVAGTRVDQVFIGSCTNGRLEDLQIAADILRGKKVSPFTRLLITPASREIYGQAAESGLLADLIDAGANVTLPGCGLCCGRAGGILAPNEVVLATNNRNFIGRMGDASVQIYLASPAVAAATALAGQIVLP
ncbi:MAG: 3-isopropylmalate dehydratase large subunit [Ruminococcaceae bacterium]|mgnify:CR=1 FL=1|nr:3-isopropylmalate dehydratase large subunit [Oscillospiraceae bacterium]